MYRTHNLGELRIENVNQEVELSGWVQKIRNLGGMIFIDLRDQFGITQIVINDEKMQEQVKNVPTESCIHICGKVVERSSKNPKMPTGDIEVVANKFEILGKCKNVLPFEINTDQEVREDLRLEYRFLDLRNEKLHNIILLRSKILKTLRDKMDELGFAEIQTPILANSSPEGARDFLVPSRLHPGEFYALPQAPQQFKQLLMVSGFDKYFQIAPCFRDEDPRADRAPGEFYQLDFEMSFATQEDVFKVVEDVIPYTFKKFTNWKVDEGPFIRIPYREAMEKYGIDKPDLRNPLIIQDVTKVFENIEFNAFKDKTVKAIVVPDGAEQGRKFFDKMTEFATTDEVGAKGLAWTKFEKDGTVQGGIAKFITDEAKAKLENDNEVEIYFKPIKNSRIKESIFCYWCLIYEEEISDKKIHPEGDIFLNKVLISELTKKKYYQSVFLKIENNKGHILETGTEINFIEMLKYLKEENCEGCEELKNYFEKMQDYVLLAGIKINRKNKIL